MEWLSEALHHAKTAMRFCALLWRRRAFSAQVREQVRRAAEAWLDTDFKD